MILNTDEGTQTIEVNNPIYKAQLEQVSEISSVKENSPKRPREQGIFTNGSHYQFKHKLESMLGKGRMGDTWRIEQQYIPVEIEGLLNPEW